MSATSSASPSPSNLRPFEARGPSPIIVALDNLDSARAHELITALNPLVWGFKLNDMFYDYASRDLLLRQGVRFFLDSKLHDIPNTVGNSVRRICENYRPELITVHASGGRAMLEAAVASAPAVRTRILAVTVLTSISVEQCRATYGREPAAQVPLFAREAAEAGCWGVVCSTLELPLLGDVGVRKVVPGIRPLWWQAEHADRGIDDHARAAGPKAALDAGADLLVIGRPIAEAPDPVEAVKRTIAEVAAV